MNLKQMDLIVGGFLPAIGLGIAALCQKLSGHHGIATGPFLIVVGISTIIVGSIFIAVEGDSGISPKAVGYTLMFAVFWATSSGLISLSLRKLGGNISQLAPLYNMNTLVAVVLGLLLLAEWRTISPPKILAATCLMIAGGILASRS